MADMQIPATRDAALPFVHRDQLDFEGGVAFDLEVVLVTGDTGRIQITGMTKQSPFVYSIVPAGSSIVETTILRIADIPVWMNVNYAGAQVDEGTTYLEVYLRMNQTRTFRLCGGYLSRLRSLSYPFITSESPTPGFEITTQVNSQNPAAGADFDLTIPAGFIYKLKSISGSLITDGTVANRRVHLQIKDTAGNDMLDVFPAQDQAASLTYTYFFAPYLNIADEFDNNTVLVSIPHDIVLYEGMRITTSVLNLKAGDDLGTFKIFAESYRRAPN